MEGNNNAMEEIFLVLQSRNNQLEEEGAVIDKGVPSNIQQHLYKIHCFFFQHLCRFSTHGPFDLGR
jgi:hypothetical protein